MKTAKTLLALDFGGTKLSAAITDPSRLAKRQWLDRSRVFNAAGKDAQTDLQEMIRASHLLLKEAAPAAIGVSFGGPVEPQAGVVRLSHHVPGWENLLLKRLLEDEFNCPVMVDNDANVAALGEYRFGASLGALSLLYITISTGVGGGWILNGKIWHGAQGMAGEIGHTTIDPQGPTCLCGKRGCVERLASGPYLAQDARQALLDDPNQGPELLRLCGGILDEITGEMLSRAAYAGDPLASRLLGRSAWAIGTAIGNAANLLNPHRVILGGGVTKSGLEWWQGVESAASQTMLPEIDVEILPAELGDDAPLWGAVALALECLNLERR